MHPPVNDGTKFKSCSQNDNDCFSRNAGAGAQSKKCAREDPNHITQDLATQHQDLATQDQDLAPGLKT